MGIIHVKLYEIWTSGSAREKVYGPGHNGQKPITTVNSSPFGSCELKIGFITSAASENSVESQQSLKCSHIQIFYAAEKKFLLFVL